MKETGIVRRIDDLGRIVIPLEIRRNLNLREGDPLEIYVESDGSIIFKKFSTLGGIADYAKNASKSLVICGIESAIFDNFGDYVSGSSSMKAYAVELAKNLGERSLWYLSNKKDVACQPILSNGDLVGYIIFEDKSNSDSLMVKSIATMLGLTLSR